MSDKFNVLDKQAKHCDCGRDDCPYCTGAHWDQHYQSSEAGGLRRDLAQLRAQLADLTRQRDEAVKARDEAIHRGQNYQEEWHDAVRRAEAAEADNARLLAELERLRKVEAEAKAIVGILEEAGSTTGWRDGAQTDRVFAWYEFDALRAALAQPQP